MSKIYVSIIMVLCFSCSRKQPELKLIDKQNFTKVIDNKQVFLFTLKNKHGLTAQITNYGGRIVSLWIPDKNGNFDDIVLGYESLEQYLKPKGRYFGALIGRYANRIAKGRFTLNDSIYNLTINNGANHLHGGKNGFHNVVWNANQLSDSELKLEYLSKDGEEGYPGNLKVTAIYKLTVSNELEINYTATTDKSTHVNLTSHSFFNLCGAGKGSINDHLLQINAAYYTPINEEQIPTGKLEEVKNTAFDFTTLKPIGEDIDASSQQLKFGFGYDHNYVLDGSGLRVAAKVIEPKSGRIMEVITDEPGLQFYGGNFLGGKNIGKGNLSYEYRTAFCLETQHFPDSPNQRSFPSTILHPDDEYHSTCIYKFTIK
ncbi:MAG TPA: aldose epimerase family protein [Yeosuana sp.]